MESYDIFEMINNYFGSILWLCCFIFSMLIIGAAFLKSKAGTITVVGILFIIVFNNYSISIVEQFSESVFYRLFWIFPVPHIMAAACIFLLFKISNGFIRNLIICVSIATVILSLNYKTAFPDGFPRNIYLMNDDIPVLSTAIKKDKKYEESRPTVIMTYDLCWAFSEYDGEVIPLEVYGTCLDIIDNKHPNVEEAVRALDVSGGQYIIIPLWNCDDAYLVSIGCRKIYSSQNYALYKIYINDICYERLYEDKINVTRIVYMDKSGQPALNKEGFQSLLCGFDEYNKLIKEKFIGIDGESVIVPCRGYAEIYYERDIKGNILKEMYFDEKEKPMAMPSGQSGRSYVYDEKGRMIQFTNLDANGNSVVSADGYATLKCKRDEKKDYVIDEHYYDEKGDPIALGEGQYGCTYKYDEQGNMIEITYIGAEEQPILLSVSGYARVVYNRYENGTIISTQFYDTEGNMVREDKS